MIADAACRARVFGSAGPTVPSVPMAKSAPGEVACPSSFNVLRMVSS